MSAVDPCICITGPTACGKTELALKLAEEMPLEVISMDSVMVYRGMDIGAAKPSHDVRARVPHHLVDILEPTEAYSAGRFARDAREVLAGIEARGQAPLIVGGTLLYLRALRDGLADLPQASPDIRLRLDEEARRLGWPALHRRLQAVDAAAARRISPTDAQRIQRALEVYELTGEALSTLQADSSGGQSVPIRALALVPEDRKALAERIARRFDDMVEAGFVDEVERLRARGDVTASMPAMRAVGYRQLWLYLAGEYGWAEARERAIAATRQLAKRQMTRLRSDPRVEFMVAYGKAPLEALLQWVNARSC